LTSSLRATALSRYRGCMKALPVVVVLGLKGGSGKSTLAIHLAVAAGPGVTLVDCDPQATALAWAQERHMAEPTVIGALPYQLDKQISRTNSCKLIVVDTAPRLEADVPGLLALSDLIVIPVRPNMPDLAASQHTLRIAQASGRRFVVVFNAIHYHSADATEAYEELRHHYELAPVMLGQRTAFARALASGRAVTEFEPHGKAAQEIAELWTFLRAKLPSQSLASGSSPDRLRRRTKAMQNGIEARTK
jgi:chromosome partitioning protein